MNVTTHRQSSANKDGVDTIAIFRAIGDETRLEIVRRLATSKKSVSSCDVVGSCVSLSNLSQPAASHHFAKLVAAGIVLEEKSGTQKLYNLNRPLLKRAGVDIDKL